MKDVNHIIKNKINLSGIGGMGNQAGLKMIMEFAMWQTIGLYLFVTSVGQKSYGCL